MELYRWGYQVDAPYVYCKSACREEMGETVLLKLGLSLALQQTLLQAMSQPLWEGGYQEALTEKKVPVPGFYPHPPFPTLQTNWASTSLGTE